MSKFVFLFLIFAIAFLNGFGKMPSHPYSFPAPNLAEFTDAKPSGYRENLKTISAEYDNSILVTYFSENGLIEKINSLNKKNNKLLSNWEYKYDSKSRLTKIKSNGGKNHLGTVLKAVEWDNLNRIISYVEKDKYGKDTITVYNLSFYKSIDNGYVLIDTIGGDTAYYTLNIKNEIVKRENIGLRTDSISVDTLPSSLILKKYWYKDNYSTIFKLGMVIKSFGDKWLNLKRYDMVFDGSILLNNISFDYSDKGLLLRTYYDNQYKPIKLYIYNDQILYKELILYRDDSISIVKYSYSYY